MTPENEFEEKTEVTEERTEVAEAPTDVTREDTQVTLEAVQQLREELARDDEKRTKRELAEVRRTLGIGGDTEEAELPPPPGREPVRKGGSLEE